MPKKIYIVDLTEEERSYLLDFVRHGKASARKFNRARILLLADEGKSDREIAQVLHRHRHGAANSTTVRGRQR